MRNNYNSVFDNFILTLENDELNASEFELINVIPEPYGIYRTPDLTIEDELNMEDLI